MQMFQKCKKKTPKQIQLKVDAIAITNVFITKYAQNFLQSLVPERTKKNQHRLQHSTLSRSVQMT